MYCYICANFDDRNRWPYSIVKWEEFHTSTENTMADIS